MAKKDERREHLLLVADNLIQTWNAWSANSDVRYITKAFEDAVDDCLLVFEDGSIPGDLRTLNARMDVLREQWAVWNKKNETSGGKYPIPDNSFWKALEAVEAERQAVVQPVRRNLETIAELTVQRVSDSQICKIYGFTDTGMPDGTPELWKLQEERAAPGRHTDRAKGWLPPWERKQQSDEAKQKEIVERISRQRDGKMRLLSAVAKESIEDLIGQGVSGKQICKMKKLDEAELAAYCEEHGLEVPEWHSPSANQTTGVHDYVPEDEAASVLAEPQSVEELPTANVADGELTLEQEIVMYHKLGTMSVGDIAKAVSRDGNDVSRMKVRAVIKRWTDDPLAFETAEQPEATTAVS